MSAYLHPVRYYHDEHPIQRTEEREKKKRKKIKIKRVRNKWIVGKMLLISSCYNIRNSLKRIKKIKNVIWKAR